MFARLAALVIWAGAAFFATASMGQQLGFAQVEILTISSDQLYEKSLFGQRIEREIQAELDALAAENRRIEADLTAEEHALTDKRANMSPTEFRELADAFDERVQNFRSQQEAKLLAVAKKREDARAALLQAARPILVSLMYESGAGAILELSSVLMSDSSINITDRAIARLDATFGEAGPPDHTPQQD